MGNNNENPEFLRWVSGYFTQKPVFEQCARPKKNGILVHNLLHNRQLTGGWEVTKPVNQLFHSPVFEKS